MVTEAIVMDIKAGQEEEFEKTFAIAQPIIARSKGHIAHSLQRCSEKENRYLFLAQWETLEDHTVGFRGSADYQEWKRLLHHFYEPAPVVQHYTLVREHKR